MQAGESPDIRAHWAIRYFRSGWAFLVPYTVAYFTYAALKWPVNPGGAGEGVVKGMSESVGGSSSLLPAPCSLLHLYWALHAAHVLLGAFALRTWWRGAKSRGQGAGGSAGSPPASRLPSPASRALSRALPWIGLALLFWIPGVYLEFPADPWQHLARTNEWSWLTQVAEHSYWAKSSYFLAYSFIGRFAPPLLQLRWFDLYYSACCLLLCWQYYRLARVVDLSERASLLFVLLNVLTFGNNVFGFYRYYGMSSTVFAQIGAVAMVRVALEAVRRREQGAGSREQGGELISVAAVLLPYFRPLVALTLLGGVTLGNHKQGILIAGAGVAAVLCWRLVAWRRSMIGWLLLAVVVASVAVVQWWPRHPLIDTDILGGGWMSPWYAFNLLDIDSAAFQRAWVIVGMFGAGNLFAGLWLLRRNHLVGWLTWMPVLLLLLPCFALPFANVLAASTDLDGGYIFAFHRILFAIPSGLATVGLCSQIGRQSSVRMQRLEQGMVPVGFALVLVLAVALNVSWPWFGRVYQVLVVPPADLCMAQVVRSTLAANLRSSRLPGAELEKWSYTEFDRSRILASPSTAYVLNAIGAAKIPNARKGLSWERTNPAPTQIEQIRTSLESSAVLLRRAAFPAGENLYSGGSIVARVAGHWLPSEVALEFGGQPELLAESKLSAPRHPQLWVEWRVPKDGTHVFGKGAGHDVIPPSPQDRGPINSGSGAQQIHVRTKLIFRPIMRSFDGRAWRLTFSIKGPGTSRENEIPVIPGPLGGMRWIYDDIEFVPTQAGSYNIELTGHSLWPRDSFTVRYSLRIDQ